MRWCRVVIASRLLLVCNSQTRNEGGFKILQNLRRDDSYPASSIKAAVDDPPSAHPLKPSYTLSDTYRVQEYANGLPAQTQDTTHQWMPRPPATATQPSYYYNPVDYRHSSGQLTPLNRMDNNENLRMDGSFVKSLVPNLPEGRSGPIHDTLRNPLFQGAQDGLLQGGLLPNRNLEEIGDDDTRGDASVERLQELIGAVYKYINKSPQHNQTERPADEASAAERTEANYLPVEEERDSSPDDLEMEGEDTEESLSDEDTLDLTSRDDVVAATHASALMNPSVDAAGPDEIAEHAFRAAATSSTDSCRRRIRMRSNDGDEIDANVPCDYLKLYDSSHCHGESRRGLPREVLIESISRRFQILTGGSFAAHLRTRLETLRTLTKEELELFNDAPDSELHALCECSDSQFKGLLSEFRIISRFLNNPATARAEEFVEINALVIREAAMGPGIIPDLSDPATFDGDLNTKFSMCAKKLSRDHCIGPFAKLQLLRKPWARITEAKCYVPEHESRVVRLENLLPCRSDLLNFRAVKERLIARHQLTCIRNRMYLINRKIQVKVKSITSSVAVRRTRPVRTRGRLSLRCHVGNILSHGRCRAARPATVLCTRSRRLLPLSQCKPSLLSSVCPLGSDLHVVCHREFLPLTACPFGTLMLRGQCKSILRSGECPDSHDLHEGQCLPVTRGRRLTPRLARKTCPAGFVLLADLPIKMDVPNPDGSLCGRLVEADIACPQGFQVTSKRLIGDKLTLECERQDAPVKSQACNAGYKFDSEKGLCIKEFRTGFAMLCQSGIVHGDTCFKPSKNEPKAICPQGTQLQTNAKGEPEGCVPEKHSGRQLQELHIPFKSCPEGQLPLGEMCLEAVPTQELCQGDIVDGATGSCVRQLFEMPKPKQLFCKGDDCKRRVPVTFVCPEGTQPVAENETLCLEIVALQKWGGKRKLAEIDTGAFCPAGSRVHAVDSDDDDRVVCSIESTPKIHQSCAVETACGAEGGKPYCPEGYSVMAGHLCVAD